MFCDYPVYKEVQQKNMKNLFLLTVLLLISSFSVKELCFEDQLKNADSYWESNRLKKAEKIYISLIRSKTIPGEYQSLVYLRLAEVQLQSGKKEVCLKTLDQMSESLQRIREHHKLRIDELRLLANNKTPVYKTPVPDYGPVAASCYVSQKSNRNGDGSKQNPFTSIEQALDYLNQNAGSFKKGLIEIILTDHRYVFNETINMKDRLSVLKENPILIRSLSGEKTRIEGGITIMNWKKETDPEILSLLPDQTAKEVLVADLKNYGLIIDEFVLGGTTSHRLKVTDYSGFGELPKKRSDVHNASLPVPELFYNNERLPMSRFPDQSDTSVIISKFTDERAEKWNKESDVWLHGYWDYQFFDCYEKFESFSKETGIELEKPHSGIVPDSLVRKGYRECKWYAINLLSEMDQRGEWKLSADRGKIWLFPPENFNPGLCVLSAKAGPVFFLDHYDNVIFKDISFSNLRGDALIANSSNNISVINCDFTDLSGMAIQIFGGKDHLIHSCTIDGMGRGGIEIAGGELDKLISSGAVIENCIIRDISRLERTYTQAIWASGVGMKIQHCLFEDMPGTAIRIEGNDMLIQFNEFNKCVYESNDQGAFETYMNYLYRGNVVRWNYFHDLGGVNIERGAGVRLDDLISGFCIDGNIFRKSSSGIFGAICINRGRDNIVENNIIVDCSAGVSVWEDTNERWTREIREYKNGYTFNREKNYIEDPFWLQRYPEIKDFLNSKPTENFFVDNAFINTGEKYARKLTVSFPVTDREIIDDKVPDTLKDYQKYLSPWHPIPLDEIGTY